MFKVTKYPHGTFSWAECVSTDSEKGKQFYADLMGWGIDDQPMGEGQVYTMYQCDGEYVAALFQIQPELAAQGVPSHWNSYISVDDVDAAAAKIKDLGGTVIQEPLDVFDSGRMLFLQDPTGARLALWQAKNHIGAGLVNTPGAMTWNELMTGDVDKAKDFYGKLLGWNFQKDENMDYHYILVNGRMNGAMMPKPEGMGDAPPNWMVYLSVADINAAVEKVTALGGTVMMPVTEAGGTGHFAVIDDPQGAVASLIQLNQPQPWSN